ncbi:MAG: hypothetical protein ACXVKO_15670 [Bacteriovorax sp.]
MTPTLSQEEQERFLKETELLKKSLEGILEFSKSNLLFFNGVQTENFSYYFLEIFVRFRLNCEGLLTLVPSFQEDYRLKVCTNLLLRSICSDVLTAIYLLTFYDKDDAENISLRNELDVISAEYLRSAKKIIEEDDVLLSIHEIETPYSIEEKREWFTNVAASLLTEEGNIKSRGQIRLTTKEEIKEGLKPSGGFITEDEKFQRIKVKGLSQFGFSFTIFKYYSQFQHFSLVSRKLIENKPFYDTFLMAFTIDQMLMTIDLILQTAQSPNLNFGEEIKNLRDNLIKYFA